MGVFLGKYNLLEWYWSAHLVWFRWSASCHYKSVWWKGVL